MPNILKNEEFKEFFKALLDENQENALYIGKIDLIKDGNGEGTFLGYSVGTEECQEIVKVIEQLAQQNEKQEYINNCNNVSYSSVKVSKELRNEHNIRDTNTCF